MHNLETAFKVPRFIRSHGREVYGLSGCFCSGNPRVHLCKCRTLSPVESEKSTLFFLLIIRLELGLEEVILTRQSHLNGVV